MKRGRQRLQRHGLRCKPPRSNPEPGAEPPLGSGAGGAEESAALVQELVDGLVDKETGKCLPTSIHKYSKPKLLFTTSWSGLHLEGGLE